MTARSSLQLLAILSSLPLALASYSFPAITPGIFYNGAGWVPTCFSGPAECFDGCASNIAFGQSGSSSPVSIEYSFPIPSTTFQWWGYKVPNAGLAQVCFDGATGSACSTVNYFDANAQLGPDAAVLLFSKTGLSNDFHTVTITNLPDTNNGNQLGFLNLDHTVMDGTVPQFPANTFISELPIVPQPSSGQLYNVEIVPGDTNPADPLLLLPDAGADDGYMFWVGCTDSLCNGHNKYVPSPALANTTIIDELCFGSGGDCIEGWRVNDTLTFGTVTTQATWDALFTTTAVQPADGNLGIAKSYWFGSHCVGFTGFVEQAFIHGDINYPVISLYALTANDNPASGVVSVAQLGGVDKNKFTGEIDWVPMNGNSAWQSPTQIRTVKASASGPSIPVDWPTPVIEFDTGDPGLLSLPDANFQNVATAVGSANDPNLGVVFPCDATLTFNMNGSQNREYTINLADPSQPSSSQAGFCAPAVSNSGGDSVNLMGVPFLSAYYVIFASRDNFMGFATKNVGASAATVSVLTGSG